MYIHKKFKTPGKVKKKSLEGKGVGGCKSSLMRGQDI
jgi:hypothetical protein